MSTVTCRVIRLNVGDRVALFDPMLIVHIPVFGHSDTPHPVNDEPLPLACAVKYALEPCTNDALHVPDFTLPFHEQLILLSATPLELVENT